MKGRAKQTEVTNLTVDSRIYPHGKLVLCYLLAFIFMITVS